MSEMHVCEQEYEFSLILSGVSELTTEVEDALFESGCDDATLSIQHGAARLEFSRTAPSFKDAILTAIHDVCHAGHGIGVVQVDECNLVTQAEIARRIGRSRQLVSQYIMGMRGPGHFPPPTCHLSETTPLWRWCEVSFWLSQNDMIRPDMLMEAEVVSIVNNALDRRHQVSRNRVLVTEVAASLEGACGCG